MNTIQERFKQHPIHGELLTLLEEIRQTKLPVFADGDTEVESEEYRTARSGFARFRRVVAYIAKSLRRSDAELWTVNSLAVAHGAVERLKAGLVNFEATSNVDVLQDAADVALDQWRSAAIPQIQTNAKAATQVLEDFRTEAAFAIRSLEETDLAIRRKEAEILSSSESFAEGIARMSVEIEAFKAQFEAQKTRVDDLVTAQQEAFNSAQTERSNLFTRESQARNSTFEQWTKDADNRVEGLMHITNEKAKEHLEEMDEHKARAKEILGIVAASGVSGHYQKTAWREWVSAEALRVLALICFGIMGFVIYHVVDSVKTPDFRWEMALFRVGVGLAFLVPAYYCGRESAKHREAEKRNRRLQIELATIEPYLEKLHDDPTMREILKEKANSYFMGQTLKEPNDDVDATLASKDLKKFEERVMDLLKAALSAAVKR